MPDTKTKLVSIPILNQNILRRPHNKPSQFCSRRWSWIMFNPHTEIKQISTTHTKTKLNSISHTKIRLISIPTLISSRIRCLNTKMGLISMKTLKSSHVRPPHKTQVDSDDYIKIKSTPIPRTKMKSCLPPTPRSLWLCENSKTCHFRPVWFCVLHIRVHDPVMQQQYVFHKYEYQLVLFETCPYCSKNPENIAQVCMPYFIFYYMERTWLRSIPPVHSVRWCHVFCRS